MKDRYLKELSSILDIPDVNLRNKMFQDKYLEYRKYCYYNDVESYDYDLDRKADSTFLLESSPMHFNVSDEELEKAINSLVRAQASIKAGMIDGISREEAEIILKADVNNARNILAKNSKDFSNDSLMGCCGFGQAITGFPLEELGLSVTVNNAKYLPDSKASHAFITCSFPIRDNDEYYNKDYIVDVTYRQFFVTIMATAGNYFEGNSTFKGKTGPLAGYYVMQSPEGRVLATELTKKGFIELTEENARIYGSGFSLESVNLSKSPSEVNRIASHSGSEYIWSMHENQEEYDYSRDEFASYGDNISLIPKSDVKKQK